MLKTIQLTFLCLLMASCHQNSSYVSRYGQSIVLNPNQTQSTSDTKLKNLITSKSNSKKINPLKKLTTISKIITNNIDFSSTKFLKGDPDCIEIIRIKVKGSLTYDELMQELIKRTRTLGGNAVGISDLIEKKETIFTNHKTKEKNSDKITNSLIKETNLLSSVTADIFKCNSDI